MFPPHTSCASSASFMFAWLRLWLLCFLKFTPEGNRNLVGNLRCFIGMQQRWSFWKCNKPEKKLKIIWFIRPGCQLTPSILLRCCSSPRPLHRALLCSVACALNPPHIITEHLRGRDCSRHGATLSFIPSPIFTLFCISTWGKYLTL